MASRYFHEFPERKITGPAKSKSATRGPKPSTAMPERTANWPTAGAGKGAGYNRATKARVVKDTPKKAGLP